MKKTTISVFFLLLVGAVSMTPAAAAKLAVLVVGLESDAASDAFATGIRYEFTQKGYELVTSTAVATKLKELRDKHAEGKTVDTVGLAAWGKENGLDFVQLVVESDCSITIGTSNPVSGREQVAQVVSCGATKYSGRGYYRTRLVSNPNQGEGLEEMVFVAGGVFEMGCKDGRDNITDSCGSNEMPVHHVRVNNFYIGKYEVTQGLWKEVMDGDLPSKLKNYSSLLGDDKPVIFVTWNSVVGPGGFLERLNSQTGKNYRLPTEAEWEYAARGCSRGICENYEFSGGDILGDVGWYAGNLLTLSPQPVGGKRANALGLHDMSGNGWEWCSDWYSISYYSAGYTASNPQDNPKGPDGGSSRICRGGSWDIGTRTSRVAARNADAPGSNYSSFTIRLVLP